ncbi:putative RNA-directed DNA polymerase, eukaryota, reverse transcriptase zinc-binding domain protein [Tanacetum coccineum]
MLFKVDFKKAFDTVSWKYLDHMLLSLGFGSKWRRWIQVCLHSARSSILVNGSPTSEFSIKRGLRQGNPLSPFLFIMVMEGLHITMKNTVCLGLIRGDEIETLGHKISHLFFADDVVIISDWNNQDMGNIIHVLQVFFIASGLKINVSKSNVYGLGASSQDVKDMASHTGCGPGTIPFSYLGSPLRANMHLTANWQPLIDRFRAKLSAWKASTLSIGGRLTLIKSVLGSLGIYYMSIFKCSDSVINSFEAMRASFFLGGSEEIKKMTWVKWENVLASFDSLWARVVKVIHGAETVFDLKGCSCNGVWSSIISSYAKLHDQNIIPENTLCHNVGDGSSILFWKDNWNGNGPLMLRFNRLYHLDVNKDCRLSDRRVHDAWVWNWNRPIIGSRNEAALALLVSELGHVIFSDRPDSWRWNMENDGIFTVHETRSHIDACMLPSISPCTAWLKVLPRKWDGVY